MPCWRTWRTGTVGARTPVLAPLPVGTKVMLLVVVPVCVMPGFTALAARSAWRHASDLRRFRATRGPSFAMVKLADAVAAERVQTTLTPRLRPGAHRGAAPASAQRRGDDALGGATAAGGRLTGERDALPLQPASITVEEVRDRLTRGSLERMSDAPARPTRLPPS